MKNKIVYQCINCGVFSNKWLGKCFECGMYNSFEEKVQSIKKNKNFSDNKNNLEIYSISNINFSNQICQKTGISEFDRVIGGGFVSGQVILIGGEPGIGKSTILLQICYEVAKNKEKVLYISGEESVNQIFARAQRLECIHDHIFITPQNIYENIETKILEEDFKLIVVDSIQTIVSNSIDQIAGSISQIKEVAYKFLNLSRIKNVPIILVGHITKEGYLSGPKLLEHMVDTVLYFEGERNFSYRILRAFKNRYGPTNEIGIFEMSSKGLIEVKDPSKYFLNKKGKTLTKGSSIGISLEGLRPIVLEIQTLLNKISQPMPRRVVLGLDVNKINIIIAIMQKFLNLDFNFYEIYAGILGGIKISDPAIDLAIFMSLFSNIKNIELSNDVVFIGEISLLGEIRTVTNMPLRLKELKMQGFKRVILPKDNYKDISKHIGLNISSVETIHDVIRIFS